MPDQRSRVARPALSMLRRAAFAGVLFLCGWVQSAHAASYAFPGNLPAGCSGDSANYSCGPLVLNPDDTLIIGSPTPATLTINGDFQARNAQINTSGRASDLKLVVTGALTVDPGARLSADVWAGSVREAGGGSVFGGSITTTGNIQLGDGTRVSGSVSSSSGTISIGVYVDVGGSIGSSAVITLGDFSQVTGNINGSTSAVSIGHDARITGTITSTSGAIGVGYGSWVSGAMNSTTGAIGIGYNSRITGAIRSTSGAIGVGYGTQAESTITSSSGAISLGYNSTVSACVKSTMSGPISLAGGASVNSVCCGSSACSTRCVADTSNQGMPPLCEAVPAGPDHLEIRHGSGAGLTCSPSTLTVVACQDAACTALYTGGVTGTLSAGGAGMTVNWPSGAAFSIPGGSGSITQDLQVTSVGSVVLDTGSVSPAPTRATGCNFGNPACTFSAADAGFLFDVPPHVSEVAQTVSVRAVRKSDNTAACMPALAGSRSLTFTCAYLNPASGTLPVRVGGAALNAGNNPSWACDTGGRAVSLSFDPASGVASTSVQYADAGQVQLSARYTGTGTVGASGTRDNGLVMTGTSRFTAAPAAFGFSATSPGPIKAGSAFGATVTALNNSGVVTPNFGLETPPQAAVIAFTRVQPTGSGASDGTFTGSLGAFNAGVASAVNLVWSEAGRGDLSAALAGATSSYLDSGLNVTGTTATPGSAGAVGRFTAHHFDVVVTPACGSFSYAAQPFSVRVTAMNGLATPGTTLNYDGSSATAPNFAQALALSDAPALARGSLSGSGVPASRFSAGVATTLAPAYTFSAKLTAAQTLVVRAIDADAVSSSGFAEGSTPLRSGRLRLSNAFGSGKIPLALSVQAQYWSGNAWVPNSADNCSVLPAVALVRSGYLDNRGAPTSAWTTATPTSGLTFSGGNATLTVEPPTPGTTGSVDVALNLGASAVDQSCLNNHPASSGAALPWLRSQQGNCPTAWASDPAARATFGIYLPETRKTLHVREIF